MADNRAWATLCTRASYLPGVIILAYTLRKHGSRYPLIVLVTEALPEDCIKAIELEEPHTGCRVLRVEPIHPRVPVKIVAERFEDTWTKLRIFELLDYEKVVYLDADIMATQSMDELFDFPLPGPQWIGATHACTCNVDKDPWAKPEWTRENCPYTAQKNPEALAHGAPTTSLAEQGLPPTYALMNSGVLVFHPDAQQAKAISTFLETTDDLETFAFPDQNVLDAFYRGRWLALGWQWNAIKTHRDHHPELWRDDLVRALHYIVDKPWAKRVGPDGVAGFKGRDGVTHGWWWEQYDAWAEERREDGAEEVLKIVGNYVDPEPQAHGTAGSPFSHKSPAEKGHGPVVRPGTRWLRCRGLRKSTR